MAMELVEVVLVALLVLVMVLVWLRLMSLSLCGHCLLAWALVRPEVESIWLSGNKVSADCAMSKQSFEAP